MAKPVKSTAKKWKGKSKKNRDNQDFLEPRRVRKKLCKFCADKVVLIDYKEINRLRFFLSERGKIIPRRISGNCARHQRQVTRAIKKLRTLAILPFVAD